MRSSVSCASSTFYNPSMSVIRTIYADLSICGKLAVNICADALDTTWPGCRVLSISSSRPEYTDGGGAFSKTVNVFVSSKFLPNPSSFSY